MDIEPMAVGVWTVLIVIPALAISAFLFQRNTRRRRSRTLAALARNWGFSFSIEPLPGMKDSYTGFTLFTRPCDGTPSNFIYGSQGGLEWQLCDVIYDYGRMQRSHMYRFTSVVGVKLPCPLPTLCIRPKRWRNWLAEAVGFDKSIVVSDKEFNQQYSVSGPDREAIGSLLSLPLLQYVLKGPRVRWEINGSLVVLIRADRQYRPEELRRAMDAVQGFVRHLHKPSMVALAQWS